MSNVVALIPARSGSKGVRDKNIRDLGGYPLIAWSIIACSKCSKIDRIIVSTDSLEYATLAKSFGAEVPFIRPKEYSSDTSSDYDFVKHALDFLIEGGDAPSLIVHIRPTTPFRDPTLVDSAIDYFNENVSNSLTSLRSIHEMSESAYKCVEMNPKGILSPLTSLDTDMEKINSARQQFPSTYIANGYVDILNTDFILKSGYIHGNHVYGFLTPEVIEIDTETDFIRASAELDLNPIYRQLFETGNS
jgi:N-acylneuraminate cytidylyltransferase